MFKQTTVTIVSDDVKNTGYSTAPFREINEFFKNSFPDNIFGASNAERPGLGVIIESVFAYREDPTPTSSIKGDMSFIKKLKAFQECVTDTANLILSNHYKAHGYGMHYSSHEQRARRQALQEVEKYCKSLLDDQYTHGIYGPATSAEKIPVYERIELTIKYTPFGLHVKWRTARGNLNSENIAI